jgi:anti-sigma regulatory factor (Ser/Thr protein kinase)
MAPVSSTDLKDDATTYMTTHDLLERPGYRHEAMFYAGVDGFLAATVPFLHDGLAAGEPALVAAPAGQLDALRDVLGARVDGIQFADMAVIGRNPSSIIAAWHEFVDAHSGSGRRLRGIGEPIFPARSAAELDECQRHEALLNVAFKIEPPLWLVCPYDTTSLPPDVIVEAHRSHPHTSGHSDHDHTDHYDEAALLRSVFAGAWPDPPAGSARFDIRDIRETAALRRFATQRAAALGVSPSQQDDVALVVSELISNAIRHGGGQGVLHIWRDADRLVCQTRNRGRLTDPLVGRLRPAAEQPDGRGMWIINQLSDLVEIRAHGGDVVITAHQRLRLTDR